MYTDDDEDPPETYRADRVICTAHAMYLEEPHGEPFLELKLNHYSNMWESEYPDGRVYTFRKVVIE